MRDLEKISKLDEKITELEEKGFKIVILKNKPDAIAVKNNEIYAVKILTKYRGHRYSTGNGKFKISIGGGFKLCTLKEHFGDFKDVFYDFIIRDRT